MDYLYQNVDKIIGGFAMCISALGYWLTKKISQRKPKAKVHQQVQDAHRVYDALQKCVYTTDVCRSVILKTHNGGGLLDARNSMYSSIIYEVTTPGHRLLKEEWQGRALDLEYLGLLRLLMKSPHDPLKIKTETIGSHQLKVLHEAHGIEYCVVQLISQSASSIYYMSFQFPKGKKLDHISEAAIDVCVNKIKRIFKKKR